MHFHLKFRFSLDVQLHQTGHAFGTSVPSTIIIILILIVICKANIYLLVVKETGGIFKSAFSYMVCVCVRNRERELERVPEKIIYELIKTFQYG